MRRSSHNVSKYDILISDADLEARRAELVFVEQSALEDSTKAALESHKRCYTMFCRSARVTAFPVSFESLGLFLIQYCKWFGNTARSIPTILSHLKRANRQYSPVWLDEESAWRLQDVVTSLRKRDPVPSRRKLPCTNAVLRSVEQAANLRNHQDFQHITMSRVAHDALLRGAELTHLRVGAIEWGPGRKSATINIHYSKAHKRVDHPERVTILDYGSTSGVAWMRQYFEVMQMDKSPPAYPLWPMIDNAGSIKWTEATSKDTFVGRARLLLKQAGYPPHMFSGHSYRSGGATDLWESHRCRPLTIKLHGRWRSDAWRLYVRDNPQQRAEEVARALAFFEEAGCDTQDGGHT